MANRESIEDGSGHAGLYYDTPEEKEIERQKAIVVSMRKLNSEVIAERDRLRTRVRDLEEAMLAISRGQGRFDKDNYQFAKNVIEDMKAIANAALHATAFDGGTVDG